MAGTNRNEFYGRYDTEQEAQRAYQLAKSGKEYEKLAVSTICYQSI